VTERGHAKVLDFSLAKLAPTTKASIGEETTASKHPHLDDLARPGNIVGTIAYMSPEQSRARKLDARSDLFSFGGVLYEMTTGQMPFRGDSAAEVFDAILNRAPVSAVRLNPDLPPELERIVHKALEKDQALRYQSAAEMRADLQRLKRDIDAVRAPLGQARALWNRRRLPVCGLRGARLVSNQEVGPAMSCVRAESFVTVPDRCFGPAIDETCKRGG
jgi:serine/threonine protein kinase